MDDGMFGDMDGDPLDDHPVGRAPKRKGQRRQLSAVKFARIPHDVARQLFRRRITGAAWLLLVEIDRLDLEKGRERSIRLTRGELEGSGLSPGQVKRGVRQLEDAGVITVTRKSGNSPVVTLRIGL
jgi:hypothetical protein